MAVIFNPLVSGSSPLSTKGDLFTFSTLDARLPVGSNGQFLKANSGTATGLEWGSGSANLSYLAVSASTTVTGSFNYYAASAASATITMSLPTAVGNTGLAVEFEKTDNTFTPVFIQGLSLQPVTVFGATITSLNTQGEKLRLVADGATGWIAERFIPSMWATYTPTFSAFGTVSAFNFWWRRNGDSIEVQGSWTNGTIGSSQARVSFPSGLQTPAGFSVIVVAPLGYNQTSTSGRFVLIQSGVGYFNFSAQDGSNNSQAVINANTLSSNGSAMSFRAAAPIAGWNG